VTKYIQKKAYFLFGINLITLTKIVQKGEQFEILRIYALDYDRIKLHNTFKPRVDENGHCVVHKRIFCSRSFQL